MYMYSNNQKNANILFPLHADNIRCTQKQNDTNLNRDDWKTIQVETCKLNEMKRRRKRMKLRRIARRGAARRGTARRGAKRARDREASKKHADFALSFVSRFHKICSRWKSTSTSQADNDFSQYTEETPRGQNWSVLLSVLRSTLIKHSFTRRARVDCNISSYASLTAILGLG